MSVQSEINRISGEVSSQTEIISDIQTTLALKPTSGSGTPLENNTEALQTISDTLDGGIVNSVNGKTGAVQLTAADVGVTPISTAEIDAIWANAGLVLAAAEGVAF